MIRLKTSCAAVLGGAFFLLQTASAPALAEIQQQVGKFGPETEAALPFTISFSEVSHPNGHPPALHSFRIAVSDDGTWLMLGGRGAPADKIDDVQQSGLHGFNPPAAQKNNFPRPSYNRYIWTYHPDTGETAHFDTETLPTELARPLQTTSQQSWYDREADLLTIVGGYGWNEDLTDLKTYDSMIQVPLGPLIEAVESFASADEIAKLFKKLHHPMLQVTGGDMVKVGNTFYLVFGQKFMGSYFAFGAGLPSGTTQEYTEEIRAITMVPGQFEILNISALPKDNPEEYHRRDLNIGLTIDAPSGEPRIAAYGGVFKKGGPGGFEHPILFDAGEGIISVETQGRQIFNAYATAVIPIWAEDAGVMSQVFFGGIGRGVYHTHGQDIGLDNDGMPFGSDVSVLTHDKTGAWAEFVLEKPVPRNQLLATNGAFIPAPEIRADGHLVEDGIIALDTLPEGGEVMIGWIYGGILAGMPQPPKHPEAGDEVPTSATDKIFEVYLSRTPGAAIPVLGDGDD